MSPFGWWIITLGYKYRMSYANLLQKHVSQKVFFKKKIIKKKKNPDNICSRSRFAKEVYWLSERFVFSNQSFESLHIADSKEEITCLLWIFCFEMMALKKILRTLNDSFPLFRLRSLLLILRAVVYISLIFNLWSHSCSVLK